MINLMDDRGWWGLGPSGVYRTGKVCGIKWDWSRLGPEDRSDGKPLMGFKLKSDMVSVAGSLTRGKQNTKFHPDSWRMPR